MRIWMQVLPSGTAESNILPNDAVDLNDPRTWKIKKSNFEYTGCPATRRRILFGLWTDLFSTSGFSNWKHLNPTFFLFLTIWTPNETRETYVS